MLRIGDFARLGGVTVRALRHYDAEGLLTPAQVDLKTGYRSYGLDQLSSLDRILALRDLGFSLADIRTLLGSSPDVEMLSRRLAAQRARLSEELHRQAARLRRLEALQRAIASDEDTAELSVRVRPLPDARVLALRQRVPSQGEPITELFEKAEAMAARDRADKSPFLVFHEPFDVEACVPVRAGCRSPFVRVLSGAPLSGSITYLGGYGQTPRLRDRMVRLLQRSGLRLTGPLREVYHRFGADQRGYTLPPRRLAETPDQFVTELQIPVEEAS